MKPAVKKIAVKVENEKSKKQGKPQNQKAKKPEKTQKSVKPVVKKIAVKVENEKSKKPGKPQSPKAMKFEVKQEKIEKMVVQEESSRALSAFELKNLLQAYRKNVEEYGHNPRCEYCHFHSNHPRLYASGSLEGKSICRACRRSEQKKGTDLNKDPRGSYRNRVKYPWNGKVKGIKEDTVAVKSIKVKEEPVVKKRIIPSKSAPKRIVPKKRRRTQDDVQLEAKQRNAQKRLKSVREKMKVNEIARKHLGWEFYMWLEPEREDILAQIKIIKKGKYPVAGEKEDEKMEGENGPNGKAGDEEMIDTEGVASINQKSGMTISKPQQ